MNEEYPVDTRNKKEIESDPVFEHRGKWYWWNEVGMDYFGPFDTPLEARQCLERYCKQLNEQGRDLSD